MIKLYGTFKNGVVVLDEGKTMPEGTRVSVEPEESAVGVLLKFAGKAGGEYPSDLARNHDHYLYGTPQREGRA
jgi:hypothetical protein